MVQERFRQGLGKVQERFKKVKESLRCARKVQESFKKGAKKVQERFRYPNTFSFQTGAEEGNHFQNF